MEMKQVQCMTYRYSRHTLSNVAASNFISFPIPMASWLVLTFFQVRETADKTDLESGLSYYSPCTHKSTVSNPMQQEKTLESDLLR